MNFDGNFSSGVKDYRMLLDLGYPEAASIKLVGDRYRLDKTARMVLFRGVVSTANSDGNRERILEFLPADAKLAVDGYNIIFTIVNYLRGHAVFISTDGFLRDAGGAHGRIENAAQFESVVELVADYLREVGVASVAVFLDSPVPMSGHHAEVFRTSLAARNVAGEVGAVKSADFALLDWPGEILATSDSAIIRRAGRSVFDLARAVLERRFVATFPTLIPGASSTIG